MTRSASPSRTAPRAPHGPLLLCLPRFLVEGLDDLVGQVRLRGAVDDAGTALLDDDEEALLLADPFHDARNLHQDLLEEPLLLPLQLGPVVIHEAADVPDLALQGVRFFLARVCAQG